MHQSYSSSVSPFQANTRARPRAAMAAAAWSWVEKMLQDDQRTAAPSAIKRLDQHGRLHGHVDAANDPRAGQRPLRPRTSRAQRHQRRHFRLRQGDFPAPEIGEPNIGHAVI